MSRKPWPVPVLIVTILYLAVGSVGFVYHFRELSAPDGIGIEKDGTEKINYDAQRLFLGNEWTHVDTATDLPKELRKLLLTTKFEDWKCEKERRLVLPLEGLKKEKGRFFKCFDDKLKLVEVIAGPRCCVKWKPRIEDVVKKLPISPKLTKARLAFMGFKVVTQLHSSSPAKGFNSDRYWTECVCPADSHSTAQANEPITPRVS